MFLPCSPGWPVGAESGREAGLARLDTTRSPQAPVFLPAAASVFSTPTYAHFSWTFSDAFPGPGPGCGRVSSGLAAPPSSSHLSLPGYLGPPISAFWGLEGTPVTRSNSGPCSGTQGSREPGTYSPGLPLFSFQTQPAPPWGLPTPPPRLCEDRTYLVHLSCLVPTHVWWTGKHSG